MALDWSEMRRDYRRRILAALIACAAYLFVAALHATVLELTEVVDIVRTRHCGDQSIADRPLRPSAELDAAARAIAEGQDLSAAIANVNYRARSSASIKLRSPQGRSDAMAKTLAERFCHVVTNLEFVDIGAYRQGQEAWLVFADGAPLPEPDDDSLTDRLLDLVNTLRSESRDCGDRRFTATQPLRVSATLQEVARRHAGDMASNGFLDHVGSDGKGPSERATQAGYAWKRISENIAAGQTRGEDVTATWLASPGHCANLMDPRVIETGVAYAVEPGDSRSIYWVQIYARPK
jgi:uncharacterized protein YkwD